MQQEMESWPFKLRIFPFRQEKWGLNHPFHEDDYGILQPHTMVLFFEI